MPKIGAQFEFNSAQPNFKRDQYETVEAMRAVRLEDVDRGHISYCKETKRHYAFDRDGQHTVDPILGLWSKFDDGRMDPMSLGEYHRLDELEPRLYFIVDSKGILQRIYYGSFLLGKKAADGESISVGFPMPIPFIFA